MRPGNAILSSYGTTIFEVMSRLAREHKAINLGQGFPDGNGPDDVRAAAASALEDRPNQYPPMLGVPELRQAVAANNARFYDLHVDWQSEVMVTSGATEALAASLFGLINPGDEVVLIEPLYDSYLPIVRQAGGVPRLVRLQPPEWTLPRAALSATFGPRTKLVVINSPMNPTGKVFSRSDLDCIADLLRRYDAYAVCDEVYEHLSFDDVAHVPLMSIDGMRERCVRIGSAGKTFSLTGWKVGYVTASPHLLAPIAKSHQFLTFTTPPNLQYAVAFGLAKGDAYFSDLSASLAAKRDRLTNALTEISFDVLPCQGTYFLTAGFGRLGFDGDDEAFCRHITLAAGVAAVPTSAFYAENAARRFVRFCFCKDDDVLDEAASRLARLFAGAASAPTAGGA